MWLVSNSFYSIDELFNRDNHNYNYHLVLAYTTLSLDLLYYNIWLHKLYFTNM